MVLLLQKNDIWIASKTTCFLLQLPEQLRATIQKRKASGEKLLLELLKKHCTLLQSKSHCLEKIDWWLFHVAILGSLPIDERVFMHVEAVCMHGIISQWRIYSKYQTEIRDHGALFICHSSYPSLILSVAIKLREISWFKVIYSAHGTYNKFFCVWIVAEEIRG